MGPDVNRRWSCPITGVHGSSWNHNNDKVIFVAAEKYIGEWWLTLLKDSMRQAGQEEQQIIISINHTCLGDQPLESS